MTDLEVSGKPAIIKKFIARYEIASGESKGHPPLFPFVMLPPPTEGETYCTRTVREYIFTLSQAHLDEVWRRTDGMSITTLDDQDKKRVEMYIRASRPPFGFTFIGLQEVLENTDDDGTDLEDMPGGCFVDVAPPGRHVPYGRRERTFCQTFNLDL